MPIFFRNSYLDLYPDTTLSFELSSPYYLGEDIDILPGGFMFTIRVPLTLRNVQALYYPNQINHASRFVQGERAEIFVDGFLMLSGILEVTEASEKEAGIRIVFNELAMLKDTPLSSLTNLGSVPLDADFGNANSHSTATLFDPDAYDYIFAPVHNPQILQVKDQYDYSRTEFQNRFIPAGLNQIGVGALTPFLKVSFLLKKAFESKGYKLYNELQNTRELQWLLMYSVTSFWQISPSASFILDGVPANLALNRHVPDTPTATWVKNICRLFSAAPFYNIFDKAVTIARLDTVLESGAYVDWSDKQIRGYTITEHDVDIDSLKFKTQTLAGFSTDNIEVIDFYKYLDTPSYITALHNLPTDRSYAIRHWDGRYYFSEHQDNSNFGQRLTRYFPNDTKTVRKPTKTSQNYESNFEILPTSHTRIRRWGVTDEEHNTQTLLAYTPSAKLQGRATQTHGENPNPDALLLYRGMRRYDGTIHNPPGHFYPLSTNEIDTPCLTGSGTDNAPVQVGFDIDNPPSQYQPRPARHSLHWLGDEGLYNRFHKTNVDFIRQQRKMVMSVMLSPADIALFQFNQKVRIGNMEYLVKKMKITLTPRKLLATEVELITVV